MKALILMHLISKPSEPLLSSSSSLIRDLLAKNNLEQYFDAIIVSSEVGVVKPSPEIFHPALRKLGADPSESIFIDDNIRHVEAAAKIGIHSIQFKSAEQLREDLTKLGVSE